MYLNIALVNFSTSCGAGWTLTWDVFKLVVPENRVVIASQDEP